MKILFKRTKHINCMVICKFTSDKSYLISKFFKERLKKSAMNYWFLIIGLVLEVIVMTDVIFTTLSFNGSGPLTQLVTRVTEAVLQHITFRGQWFRASYGAVVILIGLAVWGVLSWAGWWMVFAAHPDSLVHIQTNVSADLWEKLYYTGFSLTTLGIGDYVPNGPPWQLATVVAAAQGFFLITLSVTYLLSLISAATRQHQIALQISCWGESPENILVTSYSGSPGEGAFKQLMEEIRMITPSIADVDQKYVAYGVVHRFLALRPTESLPVAMARLNEVIILLRYGVQHTCRPPEFNLSSLERMMEHHLNVNRETRKPSSKEAPQLPDLEVLKKAGIPCVSMEEFRRGVSSARERRVQHLGLVEYHGWEWQKAVYGAAAH